ncbi:MAG: hypothetical protein QNJ47_08415 [Nostocaceae cyanobacterium]|nr:hypothetical protein [Nostocaceae cyanobacterium]
MPSDTYFLNPTSSGNYSTDNYINAFSTTSVFNINQDSALNYTSAEAETFLVGGLAVAIANADALSLENPGFDLLSTNTEIVGSDGAYLGTAEGNAAVLATYEMTGNQPFSFEFSANLNIESKEIENPDAEYSHGSVSTGFYVVDFTDIFHIEVIDFFCLDSKLISSEEEGGIYSDYSNRVHLLSEVESENIDGDDGVDFVQADYFGSYTRTFEPGTKIAIIEVNKNFTTAYSDGLLNALGSDVIYGTVLNDHLKTGDDGGKIYASHGDDEVEGGKKDDILEGGVGNDLITGKKGNDQLHGGFGDDTVTGGLGNDVMAGGGGYDTFIFQDDYLDGEYNIVEDFELDVDHLDFSHWEGFFMGHISQTNDGALLTSFDGGQVLFKGIQADALAGAIWWDNFKVAFVE